VLPVFSFFFSFYRVCLSVETKAKIQAERMAKTKTDGKAEKMERQKVYRTLEYHKIN
jgi:hypothetical protein